MTTTPKSDVLNEVQVVVAQSRANAVAGAKRATALTQRRRPGLQRALAAAKGDASAAGVAQVAALEAALASFDASDAAMRVVAARNQADLPTVSADAFSISGVVTDKTGAPLAGIHVEATVAEEEVATACTNASGSFQLAVAASEKASKSATVTLRATNANRGVLYDGADTPYRVVRGGLQLVTIVVDPAASYEC